MNHSASTDAAIDSILKDLLLVLPVFHKKLLPTDLSMVTGDLTRLHLAVMGMLSEQGQTATELARTMALPKSQMTPAVAQLVERGIVERQVDSRDRRLVNLSLTAHGRVFLEEMHCKAEEYIRGKLSGLPPEDLRRLSDALATIRDVVSRVQG
jgi:DNA-binding MarR family transcriptional regulator